jgi:Fic family protein
MAQLIAFVNKSPMNPVEVAIRAHYIFVKIHPFGDGNGRIGRLLMNYILWKNGYPMFVTENTKKKAYYESLEKSEEGFRDYLMGRYIATHRKRLKS